MLQVVNDFVWGIPLIVLILIVGVVLTVRLKGLQITKLPLAIKHIFANEKTGNGFSKLDCPCGLKWCGCG